MKKVLLIEDDQQIQNNIREILGFENFSIITADDGLTGLELAKEQAPDLIICDIMVPRLDGYGVLSALRQDESTATIPLIFLTGKTEWIDLRQGMELGADDYLTKPFSIPELLNSVTAQLSKKAVIEQQSQNKLDELRRNITFALPDELRTPLNGVIGLSKLLIEEPGLVAEAEGLKMLEEIHHSGERLYRLIQNFLLYADLELIAKDPQRVEALQNQPSSSPAKPVIETVVREKAQRSGRPLDLQFDPGNDLVQIAEPKLRKIVEEIIDNAIKFSDDGTPIQVVTKATKDTLKLSVMDYGRGMTAEQIAGLGAYLQFERRLYGQSGSGLGLVIAQRLTELHRGELRIESIPGKQTIVTIELPMEFK